MANVEHSVLTGSALHEPKGADTAVANRVYVSNGLGSGAWGVLTTNTLDTTVFPKLLHVRDEKASGTDGGTFSSGAWRTRTINTVKTNEITGASLATNQITLPAGTYFAEIYAVATKVSTHKAKLLNVTDTTDTLYGSQMYINFGDGGSSGHAIVKGQFTIASPKVFSVQHRSTASQSTSGFGNAASFGINEVYLDALFWKLP